MLARGVSRERTLLNHFLHATGRIDLHGEEVVETVHLDGLAPKLLAERVGKVVRGVCRNEQNALAHLRQLDRKRARSRRLSDTALAAAKDPLERLLIQNALQRRRLKVVRHSRRHGGRSLIVSVTRGRNTWLHSLHVVRMRLAALVTLALAALVGAERSQELSRRPADPHFRYAVLPQEPVRLVDLELSNVLLASSVDGALYGIDRTSGRRLWALRGESGMQSLLKPLVATTYGSRSRSLEQLARDTLRLGDATLLQTLRDGGLYIVEPSSGGELYILRIRPGASRPSLEKLPFSLPELVALSPFSLAGDQTRIFAAEKHTSLVELNVFTGKVGAVYDSRHSLTPEDPIPPAFTDDDASSNVPPNDDALESPWVYVGRTDYTLRVYTQNKPEAIQTLRYSTYTPNHADRDITTLWLQSNEPLDMRAVLAAPENNTIVCYDLRLARNPHRRAKQPLPPVLWSTALDTAAIDIFDVVYAPPTTSSMDASLLRPVIVSHRTGVLPTIVEQQSRDGPNAAAYVGVSPDGSLYALGRDHTPLVELVPPAAAVRDAPDAFGVGMPRTEPLRPWIGSYQVPYVPRPHDTPRLDGGPASVPLLGSGPTLPEPQPSPTGQSLWFILARVLGLALFVGVIVRGYVLIRRDRTPLVLSTEMLTFDAPGKSAAGQDTKAGTKLPATDNHERETNENELDASPAPSVVKSPPEPTVEAARAAPVAASPPAPLTPLRADDERAGPTPESTPEDPKRRRRRRGKRAGAAVLARQAKPEPSSQSSQPSDADEREIHDTGPNSLQISDEVLGYGSSGTIVFRGMFQGRAVAVKRLLRDFVHVASKEVSLLQSADNHPNVIRYYCQELTPNFLYIALEQCPASLADLVERPLEHAALAMLFEPRLAFRQITAGLQHLHSLSIVHRDIKPQNILVTLTPQHKLRLLLSDFGLSKRLDSTAQRSFSQSLQPGGTVGWRAPELLCGGQLPEDGVASRLTRAVDIFSLGCVAFYMLTGGGHPFGELYEREMHIVQNQVNFAPLQALGDGMVEAQALIERMIAPEPAQRPSAADVLRHPFFWSAQKRVSFLQDVSDRFETLERDPPAHGLVLLEKDASDVIGADWRRSFDRTFLDDLGKFRKYDPASIQDLLRLIRNKKHHFQDMPAVLRKQMSPMPEGFLVYFTRRFPRLFLHVYEVMEQLPLLRGETTFRGYYEADDTA